MSRATTGNRSATIAVTGATGVVGGMTARLLAESGVPLRLVVRDAGRAPELPYPADHAGAQVVEASFGDADAATESLRGVDTLFMVSAAESADRLEQHLTFVDAAAAAGVGHVVYTSFLGAAPDATFTLARTHHATEERIATSGMDWTFLRDSFYADFTELMAGEDGVIRGPAGTGRCGWVARADVARVAAKVLSDPAEHRGTSHDLTGPQSLNLDEVAATISRVRGREVRFHDETVSEAYTSRAAYGAPDWQLDAWVSTYTAIARGELDVASDAVERITGSSARSLEEVLRHP